MNERMINFDPSIYQKPDEPPAGSKIEKETRTRESEIRANVDFWKGLGVEVDEESIRHEIEAIPEVEKFDWYAYIPANTQLGEIWKIAKESLPGIGGKYASLIEMPEDFSQPQAFAAQYSQEPDEFSLGESAKSTLEWEKTNLHFMNPLVRIVFDMRWHQQNGSHLDETNATIFPRTRDGESGARIRYPSELEAVYFEGIELDRPFKREGVRVVITKDTPAEIIEEIKELEK